MTPPTYEPLVASEEAELRYHCESELDPTSRTTQRMMRLFATIDAERARYEKMTALFYEADARCEQSFKECDAERAAREAAERACAVLVDHKDTALRRCEAAEARVEQILQMLRRERDAWEEPEVDDPGEERLLMDLVVDRAEALAAKETL